MSRQNNFIHTWTPPSIHSPLPNRAWKTPLIPQSLSTKTPTKKMKLMQRFGQHSTIVFDKFSRFWTETEFWFNKWMRITSLELLTTWSKTSLWFKNLTAISPRLLGFTLIWIPISPLLIISETTTVKITARRPESVS